MARWAGPEAFPWLTGDDAHPRALADLIPPDLEATLSFWRVADDLSNLERIVAAVAATRDHLTKLDYVLLDESVLAEHDLSPHDAMGNTDDDEVNKSHVDIAKLSAKKVVTLAQAIRRMDRVARIDEDRVGELIIDALKDGRIPAGAVKGSLRRGLQKLSDARGGR
jgi:hypothetical protein